MKKRINLKKLLSFLLAVMLIFSSLISLSSCAEKKESETGDDPTVTDNPETTGTPEDTKEPYKSKYNGSPSACSPPIKAKDYNGHEFTFISPQGKYNYIVAEAEAGEVISEAITKRNNALQQKYNIVVKTEKVNNIVDKVFYSVIAGTIEYDAILASGSDLTTMATKNILYDLNSVEKFGLDKHYWDQNANKQLAFGDRLFFTNADLNIQSFGYMMLFNKELIKQYGLTSPYELIDKNEWTISKWAELVKAGTRDLDDNGQPDIYGLVYDTDTARQFAYSSGLRATTNNEHGKIEITLLNDQIRLETVYSKLGLLIEGHKYAKMDNNSLASFSNDKHLFMIKNVSNLSSLREMEHEYGIVPVPKFDENQQSYLTLYPDDGYLFALPSLIHDHERTFNIIEDMNYYSSFLTVPVWFEVMLARRYRYDDESVESVETAYHNRVYDLAMYNDFSGIRSQVMNMDVGRNYMIVKKFNDSKRKIENEIASKNYEYASNNYLQP